MTQVALFGKCIGEEGMKALAAALEKNNTLTQVNLNNNRVSDGGAKALATALEKNQTLTQVNLSTNHSIGDEGVKALAAALEKNQTLIQVDLSNNGIGDEGEGAKALAAVLEKNKTQAEALIEAAQAGDLAKVKQLVEQGVAVNYQDGQGNTALHYAAQHPAIVDYLLAQPQQVLLRNYQDELPKGLQQKP